MVVIKSYQKIGSREHNFTGLLKTPLSLSLINYLCFPIFWKNFFVNICILFTSIITLDIGSHDKKSQNVDRACFLQPLFSR